MEKVMIDTNYIKLDQLLKYATIVGTGGEAKILIKAGEVKVNGEIIKERGKKIKHEDTIEIGDMKFKVLNED